ncbi:MAG: FKBP-type peptidyl-prolyl cis-trans isomerase [Prevotella sp.]|nr:FKBP-type peptidyl-prolyl cis-trans isomerase [Prevotella sp.]
MKKLYILALALVASASSFAQLRTSSDSVSYAAGMSVTNGLIPFLVQQQQMDTTYMADFVRGFREAVKGVDPARKAYLTGMSIAQQLNERMLPGVTQEFKDSPDSIIPQQFYEGFAAALLKDATYFTTEKAEQYFMAKREADKAAREEKLYGANRTAGRQFLEENAKKEGVITLPSGLQYKVLVKGDGQVPLSSDRVQVNYEGRLIDGTIFDASKNHGDKPAEFTPTQVIKGWTEALTMMPVGSKWQLYIPYELAYGDRDTGKIKPFSTLIFDIELVGISEK